jgi:histone deacetylase 1/2
MLGSGIREHQLDLQQVLQQFDFLCNKFEHHSCHSCRVGKSVHLPFNSSKSITYFPFQLIHADLWTSHVLSFSGYKYYLVLIDDFTHFTWTFPIRQKSDVFHILRSFLAYTKTQFGLPLLALQTDNGREFGSNALRLLLSAHGVAFRLSCPHTSQQNGKAERILRTLNDCVRTLLIHSAAPLEFWAEALATATHLINRRPCRAMGTTTPFELLFGVPPDYGDLCVFRCLCYPNLTATAPHTLSPRCLRLHGLPQ